MVPASVHAPRPSERALRSASQHRAKNSHAPPAPYFFQYVTTRAVSNDRSLVRASQTCPPRATVPLAASASLVTRFAHRTVRAWRSSAGKNDFDLIFNFYNSLNHSLATLPEIVMAAVSIANIVKTSLGPVGLDKMLVDDVGVRHLRHVLFRSHCPPGCDCDKRWRHNSQAP